MQEGEGASEEAVNSARVRYEKAIADLKEREAGVADAKKRESEVKQELAEYEPEVWTGGVALLSALSKLSKSDAVKSQCIECLRSVSDRVSSTKN